MKLRLALLLSTALAVLALAPGAADAAFSQVRLTHFGTDGDLAQEAGFPEVAYNSKTNQFLLVFIAGPTADNHDWDVYGQLVDAAGSPVGGQFQISLPTSDQICEDDPANVAYAAPLNEFLVSWNQGVGNCDGKVMVQRIAADGTLIGTPSKQISTAFFDDIETTNIAFNPAQSEWLVAWKAQGPGAVDQELFAQRLTTDLTEVGFDDIQLTDFTTGGGNVDDAMGLAYNSRDSRYMAVVRATTGGNLESWGHMMNADGSPAGGDHFLVSHVTDTNPTGESNPPMVGYNAIDNQFLVAWNGNPKLGSMAASEKDVFGRLVGPDGGLIGSTDIRLSDMGPDGDASFATQRPDIGFNPNAKEWFVAWSGEDNTPPLANGDLEVFGQRLAANGTEIGDNDVRISVYGTDGSPSFAANRPALAYNSSTCTYMVAWSSGKIGSFGGATEEWDIYGNLVDTPCPPVNLTLPEITGTAQAGQTLACSNGTWSGRGMTFGSQWLRDAAPIDGANAANYVPTGADVGHQVACAVTATDPDGAATATSAGVSPIAAPVIAPPPVVPAAPDRTPPTCTASVAKQKLRKVVKNGLKVTVNCNERVRASGSLLLAASVAKKLHASAKTVTVGTGSARSTKAGKFKLTVKLKRKAKKALAKVRSVKLSLQVKTTDAAGNRGKTLKKTVKLKR